MTPSWTLRNSLNANSVSRVRTLARAWMRSPMSSCRTELTSYLCSSRTRLHWTRSSRFTTKRPTSLTVKSETSCGARRKSLPRLWFSTPKSCWPTYWTSSARLSHLKARATPSKPSYMWSNSSRTKALSQRISASSTTSSSREWRTTRTARYILRFSSRCTASPST